MRNTTESNATESGGVVGTITKVAKIRVFRGLGLGELLVIIGVFLLLFKFLR